MKPLIGITPSINFDENQINLNKGYINAISQAGGIPVVFPYDSKENSLELLSRVDGVLLSGGCDINPLLFDEEPTPGCGEISPTRDTFEIEICQHALAMDKPLLGICRGMQIMAVSSKGKIIQDIYSRKGNYLKHSQNAPKYLPTHTVEIKENTKLFGILNKTKLNVNSFHHQSVAENCGEYFVPSAYSSDGTIEAMEHTKNKFALGVQWHPEYLFDKYEIHLKLFETLIQYSK